MISGWPLWWIFGLPHCMTYHDTPCGSREHHWDSGLNAMPSTLSLRSSGSTFFVPRTRNPLNNARDNTALGVMNLSCAKKPSLQISNIISIAFCYGGGISDSFVGNIEIEVSSQFALAHLRSGTWEVSLQEFDKHDMKIKTKWNNVGTGMCSFLYSISWNFQQFSVAVIPENEMRTVLVLVCCSLGLNPWSFMVTSAPVRAP